MDTDFLPNSDDELVFWGLQFVTAATANFTAAGLNMTQITDFNTVTTGFNDKVKTVDTKREDYKSAVKAKDTQRKTMGNAARELNRIVQSKTTATPEVKAKLGLKTRQKGEKTAPNPPKGLSVTGNSLGENFLEWQRNGNTATTTFEIFCRTNGMGEWVFLASTNAVKHTHQGATPGVQTEYRVRARRRDVYSTFSEIAIIYASNGAVTLTLQKAA